MKIQFIFTTENNLPYRFLFIIVSPASLNAKSCRCSGPRFRRLDVRNYGVVVVVKFTIGRSQVYQFWIILCCLLIMLFVVKLADCVFFQQEMRYLEFALLPISNLSSSMFQFKSYSCFLSLHPVLVTVLCARDIQRICSCLDKLGLIPSFVHWKMGHVYLVSLWDFLY